MKRGKRTYIAVIAAGAALLGTTATAVAVGTFEKGERSGAAAESMEAQVATLVAEKKRARAAIEPRLKARAAYLASASASSRRGAARTGSITACVNKRTKVMTMKASCSRNESLVRWGQTGPAGPTGPAGAAGANGAAGPAGPAGSHASVVFYEDIYGPYTVGAGGNSAGTEYCSAGGTAINGGFLPTGGSLDFVLRASAQDAFRADGWFSVLENLDSSANSVYTYVYCAL